MHRNSLFTLLLLCSVPLRAADKLPPESDIALLPHRAAAALIGAAVGDVGPLRQIAIAASADAGGILETHTPILRGEARTPVGAAVVVLAGMPGHAAALTVPTMLRIGDAADCWSIEDPSRFRPLDPYLMRLLKDETHIPLLESSPAAVNELFLLHDGLSKVLRTQQSVLERVSRSNFTVKELMSEPRQYRGQVLRMVGRLVRVREVSAPDPLRRSGATSLYDAWILVREDDVLRQVCLRTPTNFGIAPTEALEIPIDVSVTGYFFKSFTLRSSDGIKGQSGTAAPLLLGYVTTVVDERARMVAAATTIAAGGVDPLGTFLRPIQLQAGERARFWTVEDPTRAPRLDLDLLEAVKDNKSLPVNYDLKENEASQPEVAAYEQALIKASKTTRERFEASLREEVNFAHLHNEPARYRGEVVRISGWLRRIRKFEPNLNERLSGITAVYEIWIVNDQFGPNKPVCLLCTELPEGIKVAETYKGKLNVSVMGYFFKKYLFKAEEAKKQEYHVAPLVIGRLLVDKKKKDESGGWMSMLLPFVLTMLLGSMVVVFFMTWIYRRADRKVLSRADAPVPPFIAASEQTPTGIPPDPERRISEM